MTDIFEDYFEAKFVGDGGPDGDRFKDVDGEVHTSEVGRCQRRLWWERNNPQPDEASPYFELGRVLEDVAGAALSWRYGSIDRSVLKREDPWDVADHEPRVEQDVNIRVHIEDDLLIPGEADWCVVREGWLDEVDDHGPVDRVELATGDVGGGERRVVFDDGHAVELDPGEDTPIERVIETKTIKDLGILGGSPKAGHLHQLWGYMWALNAPGSWLYMVRNDLEAMEIEQPMDESLFLDVEVRARQHRRNLRSDEYPPATPTNKFECYYCPHKDDCSGKLSMR